jgi:DedD protein
MDDNDAQSQLKKRARRRLVGAVVFASVVAVVLPMVMDHEPRQVVQEVEIRIPGQDDKPLMPKLVVPPPSEQPAPKIPEPAAESRPSVASEAAPVKPAEKSADKQPEKAPEKPQQKAVDKPPAKPEKTPDKAAEKPVEKPAAKDSAADAKRAAAILAGQAASAPETAPAQARSGEFVIMIGAFASEDNVRNLKSKLAEKNIRSYSEPLQTPGGAKTRVRAGPFPSREAAEKALEKMKQIGVSGVIAGK